MRDIPVPRSETGCRKVSFPAQKLSGFALLMPVCKGVRESSLSSGVYSESDFYCSRHLRNVHGFSSR